MGFWINRKTKYFLLVYTIFDYVIQNKSYKIRLKGNLVITIEQIGKYFGESVDGF